MATVNLGAIKFNWKGAYNNSTQYQVDDVVSSGGSSYICILASQGNAVSNGTYWEQMSAAGTNGTNGTDLSTTLTTQGDLVYRDGSGLQRLAAGTAGHVLQTGGSGANPSWTAVSSDWVKITTSTISSSVGDVQIDNIFSSTYENYVIIGTNIKGANQDTNMRFRWLDNNGSQITGNNYRGHTAGAESISSGNNDQVSFHSDGDISEFRPAGNVVDNVRGGFNFTMNIPNPYADATTMCYGNYGNVRNNGAACSGHFFMYYNGNKIVRGIKFDYASGNIASGKISVYGIKI